MKEQVLQQKQAVINEIKENIENAKSLVLVDYRGLNVSELTELRKRFREENVLYKVYKNTMMDFAFKELGYEDILESLEGPNAVAFSKIGRASCRERVKMSESGASPNEDGVGRKSVTHVIATLVT